ncbi:HIT domain-containing protein [Gammaproteobacteria bacterium]|nr:HIT domain-containing protein [Gammaproteobacteria bacterium]
MKFVLDERLQRDCFFLGRLELSQLLLLNNAAVPWFILVPEVAVTELCDLDELQHTTLMNESQRLAEFIRQTFVIDKLNVAAIGNVVSQLHLHVIGRRKDDYCWPDVVWGTTPPEQYEAAQVATIVGQLEQTLEGFRS